jgi:hypothetical protein
MLGTPGLTSSLTSLLKSVENKPSLAVALLDVVDAVVLDVVDMELFVVSSTKVDNRIVVVSAPMDTVTTTKNGLELPMETTTVTMVAVMDTVMMLVVVASKEVVVPLLLVVQVLVLEPVVVTLVVAVVDAAVVAMVVLLLVPSLQWCGLHG